MIPADERKFLDAGIFIGAILLGDRGIPKLIRWSKRHGTLTFVPVHQWEF